MPTVEIGVSLHPAQEEVWTSPARFRVVGCGRRWGKTYLGVLELLYHALTVAGGVGWWVSPTHDQSSIAWRMMLDVLPKELATINNSTKLIRFSNGSFVQFKSADREKNLRGEGLTFVVLDEAAFLKDSVFYSAIRPSLSDLHGSALMISTFDGVENWFYEEWEQGQSDNPEYQSWRFPTAANPFIPTTEIEAARRSLPEIEFRQEYEADPVAFVGAVFPGEKILEAAHRGQGAKWSRELDTHAGLDWGYTNATVFEVCQEDAEGRVTWLDERVWVQTQLDTRVDAIAELCRQYKVQAVYADAAGASENAKLLASLENTTLVRVPFGKKLRTGETAKDAGIKTRRWYLENDLESLGPRVPELIRTSKRYHYKEGSEDVEKEDDHPVDAATAFYASRRSRILEER